MRIFEQSTNEIVMFLDDSGRYSYKQQPSICKWNCGKLAEALGPLLPLQRSRTILDKFDEEFDRVYINKMRQKVTRSFRIVCFSRFDFSSV